jgi:hypothetical protein
MADPEERPGYEAAMRGARASGTPFISYFTPADMLAIARSAGFSDVRCVSGNDLATRYFAKRADGLHPGSETLLVATT